MTTAHENPWLTIPAADYDGHMGPDHADQLGPLSEVFAEVYRETRPARLAFLGCATGNGLEHVDPAITERAIAIDLNPEYVAVTRARHAALGAALEVRCADVCSCDLPAEAFDLIHAALLFEYVEVPLFAARIAGWLAPGGTCAAVLQVHPPTTAALTPSPYHSFAPLRSFVRLVAPEQLAASFAQHGLHQVRGWSVPLKGDKQLAVGLFRR